MQFKDIVGQEDIINRLTSIIDSGRVSHAQMLLGEAATSMPLAWGLGTFAVSTAYITVKAPYVPIPVENAPVARRSVR